VTLWRIAAVKRSVAPAPVRALRVATRPSG
jgi:hypothetical protein